MKQTIGAADDCVIGQNPMSARGVVATALRAVLRSITLINNPTPHRGVATASTRSLLGWPLQPRR
ncbi:MAG: hypothetical protein DME91_00945 [Verrucomicrobia bacterium]|nr:MAG: hypothetical protein DME91_00945 [Verrucomicrobiota bacterium]